MKKLMIILMCVLVVGCSRDPMNRAKQDYVCKEHGGVYKYHGMIGAAECRDGTRVPNWVSVTLTPEFYPEAVNP